MYTAGPWEYMGRHCSAQIRGPRDQIVAHVEWEHDPSWGKFNVQIETETAAANGRLIAAAPDLLETGKAWLAAVDHYSTETFVIGSGQKERAYERMELARRAFAVAVAKAEGKADE